MNTQKEFEGIVQQLVELRKRKNADYGDGFLKTYDKYGDQALFFDLLRKWQRLETLLLTQQTVQVSDETIEDTLGDLAVMCVNGMVWRKGRNVKPN